MYIRCIYGVDFFWDLRVASQLQMLFFFVPGSKVDFFGFFFSSKLFLYIVVSSNGGFSPQIIHFNRGFHYKSSILGYHYFRKPTHSECYLQLNLELLVDVGVLVWGILKFFVAISKMFDLFDSYFCHPNWDQMFIDFPTTTT